MAINWDGIWTNTAGVQVRVVKEDSGARIEFVDVERGILATYQLASWRCDRLAEQLRLCGREIERKLTEAKDGNV